MKKALSLFLALVMVALMIPFAAFVTSANGETATGITETDFTTLPTNDGTSGDINPDLPEGFVVDKDTVSGQISAAVLPNGTKNGYTSINYTAGNNGILLGGENVKLAMNSKAPGVTDAMRNGTEDYVLEFTWNTSHKYRYLHFGWTETEPTYKDGTANLAAPTAFVRTVVECGAGNTSGSGTFVTTSSGLSTNGTWGDENGTAHGSKANIFKDFVTSGASLTFSLVVKSGELEVIHISNNGFIIESYYNKASGASAMPAKGYFTIWNNGWGGNNAVNINSIRVKPLAANETFTKPLNDPDHFAKTGNVVHYVDLTNKADADAIPYDTWGDVNYRNNALWVEEGDSLAGFIKIDKELFGALSTYTVEFKIAAGSASRILMLSFNANDDASSKFGYSDDSSANVKMRFSTAGYGLDNGIVEGNPDDKLPTEFGERMCEEGFKISCVIINGTLTCYVVTLDDGSSVSVLPDRKMKSVSGGISLCQTTTGGSTKDGFGLESVKIIDAPIYGVDLPEAPAEILAPAGKAVVKNGTSATVVNAGTELTDAIAMKTNGIVTDLAPVAAGNVYAPITKADIAAGKLTAADAELRLGANPGMRYKTSFAGSDFDLIMDLTALNTPAIVDVKMGTLVTVDTYLEGAGAFTADALKAYGEEIGKNVYMDITADAAALYAENTFAGSIISVKDFTRNYVARAYITVTFADATTATIYADATDAISIKGLAAAIVAAEYAGYTTDAEKAALDFLATFGDVAA